MDGIFQHYLVQILSFSFELSALSESSTLNPQPYFLPHRGKLAVVQFCIEAIMR